MSSRLPLPPLLQRTSTPSHLRPANRGTSTPASRWVPSSSSWDPLQSGTVTTTWAQASCGPTHSDNYRGKSTVEDSFPSSSPSLPIASEAAWHLALLFPSKSSSPARSLVEGHQDVLLISVFIFQATGSVQACGWNSRSKRICAVLGDHSAWALYWHLAVTIPPTLSRPRF
jgi:hypothetical protein